MIFFIQFSLLLFFFNPIQSFENQESEEYFFPYNAQGFNNDAVCTKINKVSALRLNVLGSNINSTKKDLQFSAAYLNKRIVFNAHEIPDSHNCQKLLIIGPPLTNDVNSNDAVFDSVPETTARKPIETERVLSFYNLVVDHLRVFSVKENANVKSVEYCQNKVENHEISLLVNGCQLNQTNQSYTCSQESGYYCADKAHLQGGDKADEYCLNIQTKIKTILKEVLCEVEGEKVGLILGEIDENKKNQDERFFSSSSSPYNKYRGRTGGYPSKPIQYNGNTILPGVSLCLIEREMTIKNK